MAHCGWAAFIDCHRRHCWLDDFSWIGLFFSLPHAVSNWQKDRHHRVDHFLFAAFWVTAAPGDRAPSHALEVFDSFFRVGSLVFGGGHVVLPLLQTEVVGPGWITNEQFVAGYGATQAVPGPLFTFSAYLGAVMGPEPNGWTGAFLALVAIFLPSFLLVVGALPFWDLLRSAPVFQSALKGINAAVVGLLLTALYKPVWTSAIFSPADFGLGLVAFGLLMFWKCPPWLVVILTALGGEIIARV